MQAVHDGRLSEVPVHFSEKSACCVVLASEGYPQKYETGYEITVDPGFDAELYVAGAKRDGDTLKTGGGRVLGVVSTGDTLRQAIDRAYENAARVHFDNKYCRTDIGQRALKALT